MPRFMLDSSSSLSAFSVSPAFPFFSGGFLSVTAVALDDVVMEEDGIAGTDAAVLRPWNCVCVSV